MVAVPLLGLGVRASEEAPWPLQGLSPNLLTSSSCCCCLARHRGRRAGPRLSHSCLAPLHSSNNPNYISNANGWGLVSSVHSRKIHKHTSEEPQIGLSFLLQRLDFTGSLGPGSLITPAVPHCRTAHSLYKAEGSYFIGSTTLRHPCSQREAKLHRRVQSIIQ